MGIRFLFLPSESQSELIAGLNCSQRTGDQPKLKESEEEKDPPTGVVCILAYDYFLIIN